MLAVIRHGSQTFGVPICNDHRARREGMPPPLSVFMLRLRGLSRRNCRLQCWATQLLKEEAERSAISSQLLQAAHGRQWLRESNARGGIGIFEGIGGEF